MHAASRVLALVPAILAFGAAAIALRRPEPGRDSLGRFAAGLTLALAVYPALAYLVGGGAVVGGDRAMGILSFKLALFAACFASWLVVGGLPVLDALWRAQRRAAQRARSRPRPAPVYAPPGYAPAPAYPPGGYPPPGYAPSPNLPAYVPPQQGPIGLPMPHLPPAAPLAPQPPVVSAGTPASPATDDIAGRLRVLGELKDRGLITPDEYEERRKKILERI
jgi:hypothetical protein